MPSVFFAGVSARPARQTVFLPSFMVFVACFKRTAPKELKHQNPGIDKPYRILKNLQKSFE
jgi:hypothetical protein